MYGRSASRPQRRCAQVARAQYDANAIPQINEEYLVGYVLDDENPEMIMKKFEMLEQMQKQFQQSTQQQQQPHTNTNGNGNGTRRRGRPSRTNNNNRQQQNGTTTQKGEGEGEEEEEHAVIMEEEEEEDEETRAAKRKAAKGKEIDPSGGEDAAQTTLTEKQLKEVFKMTSNFTVSSAMASHKEVEDDSFWVDLIEEAELREIDGEIEFFDESEIWEDEDDQDDYTFFETSRKRKPSSSAGRSRGAGAGSKDSDAEPAGGTKMVSCEVVGTDGRMYRIKKKARMINPLTPVYTRVPPTPIPLSWAKRVKRLPTSVDLENNKLGSLNISVRDIIRMDLDSYGPFQGILMDPPWQLPDEPAASCADTSAPSAI
eukprot:TRINITY_DN1551_c0_g2_i2.p1 TRINITY_DN1551_c0_g2~~TRINITY_DN1551_c0_g2_i2.p1  ORF type:complete len:371 (-),score=103.59 TRINITY_DN1551_c0_g2_i2:1061-2173(-)